MKHNQRSERSRRTARGVAKPDHSLQMMSVARRYARCDRQLRPVHCGRARKLMYDSEEIATATGERLRDLSGKPHWAYRCQGPDRKLFDHFHLTTEPPRFVNGVRQNDQA